MIELDGEKLLTLNYFQDPWSGLNTEGNFIQCF